LIEIIFSFNPSPRSSCCCGWREFERSCALKWTPGSELATALAGGVGQPLAAAMEAEAGAVECNRLDAQRLRALGDAAPDQRRGGLVAAVLDVLAHFRLERRGAGKHLVAGRRDDLRVDVRVRPVDGKPRCALLGDAHPGFAGAADSSSFLVHG
jgi:hypothetical protein